MHISDTSRNEHTLCAYPNCQKTVWRDANGVFSSYCGASHRDAMVNILSSDGLCQLCQIKPKYVENGFTRLYCGRYCAKKWQNGMRTPSASPSPPSLRLNICKLSNCDLPVYVSRDGTASQWCSLRHGEQGVVLGSVEACLLCGRLPKALVNGKESDFCSRKCGHDAVNNAPIIFAVNRSHAAFENVSRQFLQQWKHQTPLPTVVGIWKIFRKKAAEDQYSLYSLTVERQNEPNGANIQRRFHGTVRACTLGDNTACIDFCKHPKCSICGIIESSYDIARARSHTKFQRFGPGIYTSATSSKADSYVEQTKVKSPYSAMLLNEVVLGKEKILTVDSPFLSQAPKGYDSVHGKPGGNLNYDEYVVYKNEAIRPLFLIIYKK